MFEAVEQRAMVERENVESGRGGEASDKMAMDFKSEEGRTGRHRRYRRHQGIK